MATLIRGAGVRFMPYRQVFFDPKELCHQKLELESGSSEGFVFEKNGWTVPAKNHSSELCKTATTTAPFGILLEHVPSSTVLAARLDIDAVVNRRLLTLLLNVMAATTILAVSLLSNTTALRAPLDPSLTCSRHRVISQHQILQVSYIYIYIFVNDYNVHALLTSYRL